MTEIEQKAQEFVAAQYADDPTQANNIRNGNIRNEEICRAELES